MEQNEPLSCTKTRQIYYIQKSSSAKRGNACTDSPSHVTPRFSWSKWQRRRMAIPSASVWSSGMRKLVQIQASLSSSAFGYGRCTKMERCPDSISFRSWKWVHWVRKRVAHKTQLIVSLIMAGKHLNLVLEIRSSMAYLHTKDHLGKMMNSHIVGLDLIQHGRPGYLIFIKLTYKTSKFSKLISKIEFYDMDSI